MNAGTESTADSPGRRPLRAAHRHRHRAWLFEHSEDGRKRTSHRATCSSFYSDGITEAEDPEAQPLEESGLELVLERHAPAAGAIAAEVLAAVQPTPSTRFGDDLTISSSSGAGVTGYPTIHPSLLL